MFAMKFWGGGNWILLYNTAVSLWTGLASFLLLAEFPFYMRHMHITRGFSFFLACFYNFFYVYGLAEYLYGSREAHKDGDLFDGIFFLVDIFFGFNTAFYFPIFYMNMILIGRELVFEFRSEEKQAAFGGDYDELRIGLKEMWGFFWKIMNFFNPLWWIFHLFARGQSEIDELNAFESTLDSSDLKYVEKHGELPKDYETYDIDDYNNVYDVDTYDDYYWQG